MDQLSKALGSAWCALALAAYYFPQKDDEGRLAASFQDAYFFFTGHLDLWDQWRIIDHAERQRISAVLRHARQDFESLGAFTHYMRGLLTEEAAAETRTSPFLAVGDPARATMVVPRIGDDILAFVDRTIQRLRRHDRPRRPFPPAGPGDYATRETYIAGRGLTKGRVRINATATFESGADAGRLPDAATIPYRPCLELQVKALLRHAKAIDKARYPKKSEAKNRYLYKTLKTLFEQLQYDEAGQIDILSITAGPVEVFNAPTGTGKSVLVRVAASWCAIQDIPLAIILPNVEATLSATWDINGDLQALGRPELAAPMMSPSRLHERAMKVAARIQGPFLTQPRKTMWKLGQLSYGCALPVESTHPYPPGLESCNHLLPFPPQTGRKSCPWQPTCGKFEQYRAACERPIVITNHHFFMLGRFPIGVVLDGRQTGDLSVAKFLLRTRTGVVIDEVDQFMSSAVDACSSEIILDSRKNKDIPLLKLHEAVRGMSSGTVKELSPTLLHARYLTEFLLASLCSGDLRLRYYNGRSEASDQPQANSSMWHLAGSRDRRLICLLFPELDIPNEKEVPLELFATLNAIHPPDPARIGNEPAEYDTVPVLLDPDLQDAQNLLGRLLASRGTDLLSIVRTELHAVLEERIPDAHQRSETIELLIIRVWLTELDRTLDVLRNATENLRSVGLPSAQDIAAKLGPGIGSDVIRHGALGRGIYGYRVTGLDDPDKSAELTTQSLSGDPHTYTAQLGSIVALVLAGMERPVLGLSATAYFPEAVREHIRSRVKWWMTDAAEDSIRAKPHMLRNALNQPIQISGLPQHLKHSAITEMGRRLYEDVIHDELERLAVDDEDRAHDAVVLNSYEHCRYMAIGMYGSGRYQDGKHRVCVAVPPDRYRRAELQKRLPLPPGIIELTPDEFEDFPNRGEILIVPMARIARGLNIVIGIRSAITSVYLCTRPLALMTDPAELYASVNAAGLNAVSGPSAAPVELLQRTREAAWARLHLIMRSAPGFVNTHRDLQKEIVAGMIIDMIQLAGRARRGGTDMTLHLVDHAFQEDSWQADLRSILRRIHRDWTPQVARRMNDIYREALSTFLAYAGIDTTEGR
ncbi:hypothetical protein [Kitasatospora sp. NPDC056181]|uniref:hypothetical protein n=1 Tax=Kitasatospora sp. NPDC056181 TaxID=3345737 RepID=UPI0035DD99D7